MAKITAAQVKELRDRTGLGMMDCKRALEQADGDLDLAIDTLRKSSALKAAKKSGRTAADGLLGLKISEDGTRGVIAEVNIETDFAALNEKFIAFVQGVADAAFEQDTDDVAVLMEGEWTDTREKLVQEIGENISVRRIEKIACTEGQVYHYIHGDNRQGCLLALSGGDAELGRKIAMHITASKPEVVSADQVPEVSIAKEREIFAAQAADSGKAEEIIAKIVDGKIRKYLAEISLTEQAFVMDTNLKVGQLLADNNAVCQGFVRLEVGEGIDVDTVDFASEVAAQLPGKKKDDNGDESDEGEKA